MRLASSVQSSKYETGEHQFTLRLQSGKSQTSFPATSLQYITIPVHVRVRTLMNQLLHSSSLEICTGLPSVRAWEIFFLPLWRSLQTVPLDTFIRFPALSCVSSSRSTNLMASSSAGSRWIGSGSLRGYGVNLSVLGVLPIVTGFRGRPLRPRLRLLDIFGPSFSGTLIYFCALSQNR